MDIMFQSRGYEVLASQYNPLCIFTAVMCCRLLSLGRLVVSRFASSGWVKRISEVQRAQTTHQDLVTVFV